jgi:nucleoside-diphosphate-sugar epimerase
LIEGPGVELVTGRLQDPESLGAAVDGVDAVYHLAGALTSRGNSDEEFFTFNLRGTYDLLRAVRDRAPGVRRFAYASSDAVYMAGGSSSSRYLPIDESHPKQPASIYGASKLAAEEMCLTFQRMYGIPATILRFGATADADELVTAGSIFSRWLFTGDAIAFLSSQPGQGDAQQRTIEILRSLDDGSGKQLFGSRDLAGVAEIRQWGDARDVAEGCLLALENRAADGEAFNLGGVAPFTSPELVRHISLRTGYPAVEANLPTARPPWTLSNAKARGLLGYQPKHSVFDMVDQATGA